MYIAKLTLSQSLPSQKVIREITFKSGANFIVDSRIGEYSRGNGIGKTTCLRVIDLCMGAKGRKYLYTDEELGLTNEGLKDYIDGRKLYAELVLQDSLTEPKVSHILSVDLYTNGKRAIDGHKLNETDYKTELNKILFGNNSNTPKFRELIGMFIRVNLKDDNNKFLKYLDNFSSSAQYDNAYSFLFGLGDPELNGSILDAKQRIVSVEGSITQLFSMNRIKDISSIEQEVVELQKEIKAVRQQLDNIVDINALKENEEEISYVRKAYSKISADLNRYNYKLQRATETLKSAQEEKEKKLDETILRGFYDDVKLNVSSLSKTFEELVNFNEHLISNKISYFTQQSVSLKNKIEQLADQRDELLRSHDNAVTMIKDRDVEGYVAVQGELEELIREQAKLQKIVEIHKSLTDQLEATQNELRQLEDSNQHDPKTNLSQFNSYFTEYSAKINDESFMLYRNQEGFPLAIKNRSSGVSTGTKKSAIVAFDLAYQSYAEKEGISHPHFVIHDLIENMDSVGLSSAVTIANSIGCQYIVAVLKEKIDNAPEINQTLDVRLRLTQGDKFFKYISSEEEQI